MRFVILLLFLSCPLSAQNAEYFRERVNLVFLGQHESGQKNIQTNYYSDLYISYLAYRDTNNFMIGPYFIAGISGNQNSSGYTGSSQGIGAGVNFEWYTNKPRLFEFWCELNTGLRGHWDNGLLGTPYGKYEGHQKDLLYSIGLSSNVWRKDIYSIFPRTQIQSGLIVPLTENKRGYWNGQQIVGDKSWSMLYAEILLKQSLVNLNFGHSYLVAPKIVASWSYSEGDFDKCYGLGGELSLHRPYRDDCVSVNCIYKRSRLHEDRIAFGLIMNLATFF